MPAAFAIAAAVQCVASCGGSALVSAITRSIVSAGSGGMRDGVAGEPVNARLHEPLLPAPDGRLVLADCADDAVRPDAVRRQQNDPRPPDILLRGVAIPDD